MNSDIENKAIKWRSADWNRTGNDTVDAVGAVDASVPVERAVEFRVNGKSYATLHCTPDHLEELAAGFLLGQGLVSSMAAITLCKPVADGSAVDIEIHGKLDSNIKGAGPVFYSGCGQNPRVSATGDTPRRMETITSFSAADLRESLSVVLKKGELYRRTRGVHSAGICNLRGGVMAFREDIGRHNALDKVLGWAAGQCLEPGAVFIASSGRISADAVAKLVRFRIPLMIAKGVPTSMALTIAEESGVTLAGRARGGVLRVYTCPDRISA